MDTYGNIFVLSQWGPVVRKIDTNVSRYAGTGNRGNIDGDSDSATFNEPAGIAVDSFGNVFVADSTSHTIRKLIPSNM